MYIYIYLFIIWVILKYISYDDNIMKTNAEKYIRTAPRYWLRFESVVVPCEGKEEQCGDYGQGVQWPESCNAVYFTKALAREASALRD